MFPIDRQQPNCPHNEIFGAAVAGHVIQVTQILTQTPQILDGCFFSGGIGYICTVNPSVMLKFRFLLILLWCLAQGDVCAQQPVIDSLKRVLGVTRIDTARVNLYNALAHQYRESNPDSTQFFARKALALSVPVQYRWGTGNAHLNMGNAQVILSQYPKALDHFTRAQRELKALQGSEHRTRIDNALARAYASAGVVYSEQNNYSRALEQYFKALKTYQKTGHRQGIAKAYNNIAVVYKSEGNFEKALSYLEKAYGIQRAIGEQSAPVTLTNLGAIYAQMGNGLKALEYYKKAEKMFTADNKRGQALLYNYLGDYFRTVRQPAPAREYYSKAIALYRALDNRFGTALVLYNTALLEDALGNTSGALALAVESLGLATAIGTLDQIAQSEKLASDLYAKLGEPTQALAHFKAYVSAKDSLENRENAKKSVRAEMDFEYEKKEALYKEQAKRHQQFLLFLIIGGLLLLTLIFVTYNRLQIKRRLTLQKEVAEYEQKALHLQMNPHFVFNCLGSISSFIVQNGTDSAIRYLSKFSKLMRLTLEYSKGSLIPIDKEIEGLRNYLELEQLRFNQKFHFAISASGEIEDDMALPPLLIQPFVENAILHGMVPKEGEGSIKVRFDVRGNQLVCMITDDGIGYQKSRALKEKSVTAHQSMALDITKKRLEMMEATTSQSAQVTIEETKDGNGQPTGTRVTISLPIQYTSDTKIRI